MKGIKLTPMQDIKYSAKLKVLLIITAVIMALGVAAGLFCEFLADGFFNYGSDYSTYSYVIVKYSELDMSQSEVEAICDASFDEQNIAYYTKLYSDTSLGSQIEYRFTTNVDTELISDSLTAISDALNPNGVRIFTGATSYSTSTIKGGTKSLMWAGITIAICVAVQFVYFLLRYKLMMACASAIANVHNLAITIALLAFTRVEIGSWVFGLGVFAVIFTMIECAILFDKMRKDFRTSEYKALPSLEQVDKSANEGFKLISKFNAAVIIMLLVAMLFTLCTAGTLHGIYMIITGAILAVLAVWFGTLALMPCYYAHFKAYSDKKLAEKEERIRTGKKSPREEKRLAKAALKMEKKANN